MTCMMDIILAVYVIEFVIKLIRFTIGIVFRRDSTGFMRFFRFSGFLNEDDYWSNYNEA